MVYHDYTFEVNSTFTLIILIVWDWIRLFTFLFTLFLLPKWTLFQRASIWMNFLLDYVIYVAKFTFKKQNQQHAHWNLFVGKCKQTFDYLPEKFHFASFLFAGSSPSSLFIYIEAVFVCSCICFVFRNSYWARLCNCVCVCGGAVTGPASISSAATWTNWHVLPSLLDLFRLAFTLREGEIGR